MLNVNYHFVGKMIGCCVPGCYNNSEKGFSLRRFPSNNERKELWVSKINRKNWRPTSNSHICEASTHAMY